MLSVINQNQLVDLLPIIWNQNIYLLVNQLIFNILPIISGEQKDEQVWFCVHPKTICKLNRTKEISHTISKKNKASLYHDWYTAAVQKSQSERISCNQRPFHRHFMPWKTKNAQVKIYSNKSGCYVWRHWTTYASDFQLFLLVIAVVCYLVSYLLWQDS
jgi:hypothetical protein